MNLLPNSLLSWMDEQLNVTTQSLHALSGGDISTVFRAATNHGDLLIKVNAGTNGLQMFEAEKIGLKTIGQTKTIRSPETYFIGKQDSYAVLVMEYIPTKSPTGKDLEKLGHQLAQLHLTKGDFFGGVKDNFIGSLPQSNNNHTTWPTFYVQERLWPQLELALKLNRLSEHEIPSKEQLLQRTTDLMDHYQSSLLHGDLWSGNYLIHENGTPYLIDPAIYYGHHEVDIAMTQLFGGFGPNFYNAYQESFAEYTISPKRIEWYQLYYLLVHLNLFGRSYYSGVIRILNLK